MSQCELCRAWIGNDTERADGMLEYTEITKCNTNGYPGLFMNPRRMVSSCCGLPFDPKPGTDRRLARWRFRRSVRSLERNAHAPACG